MPVGAAPGNLRDDTLDRHLVIRVLGPFEVLAGDEPVTMPPSKTTRALLAYLALNERQQRRERLCEIFWELPDDPKGALRWSLSKIRHALKACGGDHLLADRATVAIAREGLAIDWLELKLAAADGFEELSTERLEELAAGLRGGLLEDLALPRCPDYEVWRMAEAAQAEAVAAQLLRLLVEHTRDEPEWALHHAAALRAWDPDVGGADATIAELRQAAGRQRPAAQGNGGSEPATAADANPGAAAPPRVTLTAQTAAVAPPCEVYFCTSADGTRIAWSAAGEGPPIVRAAHWMSHLQAELDSARCRHLIYSLAAGNRLIRYDMRANDLSD